MRRRLGRFGAICMGALLAGCLGGELDTPTTPPPEQNDTTVVVNPPPPDTTPPNDTAPVPKHQLYPALKAGDKWVFLQWSGQDTGATATIEIAGDSVIASDSVFVELLTVEVPTFIAGDGTVIQNYKQTGRLYLRKADQEPVQDTVVTRMDLWFPGDSAAIPYREEEWSRTSYTGALPDSLKEGAAWSLKGSRHRRITAYLGEQLWGMEDTTLSRTRSYTVKSSPDITVKAGTFAAVQIDWSDAGSTGTSSGWFAPAAKTMVREIDSYGATSDTTELSSYHLE